MAAFGKILLCAGLLFGSALSGEPAASDLISGGNRMDDKAMYQLPDDIQSRWASMENPDAEKGAGGKANFGRKGAPCRGLKAGESFVMAHGKGSGTVRRMWITISERTPELMRGIVIRMYWDGAKKPAVEAPIGDFFCQPLGRPVAFENAWFDNPEGRSFNCRIPMPFRKGFKITATNESPRDLGAFFHDVNFTLGDNHGKDVGYFHAHYRRENPTTMREDFEILPKVRGKGRFLGCSMGCIADMEGWGKSWWGEGEVKVYLDGDREYPTLCGTGTEDYIATAWGQGKYDHLWHGCPLADYENMQYGFYRLHGPDPIYFHRDIRVTIQQIGCCGGPELNKHLREKGIEKVYPNSDGKRVLTLAELEAGAPLGLFEREDDWCAVAYFYLNKPTSTLRAIEPYEARVAGLKTE